MAYIRCGTNKANDDNLDGTTVSGGGGYISFTPFRPTGGDCSGSGNGKSTLTITFPNTIDLSKYNVTGGTIIGNTIKATSNTNVSLNTNNCVANFGGFHVMISDKQ